MKKILITGGAGFIGSEVVRKFLTVKSKVIVYDNFSNGKKEFLPRNDGLTIVEGDINDAEYLNKIISLYSPDYICHLAALHYIPYCNANPTKALMVNAVGTESVLNACKNNNIDKVLVASTGAVYPVSDLPNSEEKTKIAPIDIYGLSKMFTELLSQKFFRETGIVTIILRIFNAVGPRETNPHVIPHIFESLKISNDIPLGNIKPKRDYIHTRDIADAIYAICECNINGCEVFNLGTGKEYSVEEIVKNVEKILNRSIIIKQVKERMREVERTHLYADISKIKNVTGWEPKIQITNALENIGRYYGIVDK